ncbi:hypothetical protein ACET3Z_017570 [Daucus carota]
MGKSWTLEQRTLSMFDNGDAEIEQIIMDVNQVTIMVSAALFSGISASFSSQPTMWKGLRLPKKQVKMEENIQEPKQVGAESLWALSKKGDDKENIQFKAFRDEGIEPELEAKMEQLFGVSVAQGVHRFTPVQIEKEPVYIPSTPSNVWDDNTSNPSPHSNEYDVTINGSKRVCDNSYASEGSKKYCRPESSKKKGAGLLLDKLDTMVKVVMERSLKDMELMNLEACNLANSSTSLADSLAKLISLPDLIPGSPEFCFACTLIEDPQKRIILDGMPDDYSRIQWLKYLYQKSEKSHKDE